MKKCGNCSTYDFVQEGKVVKSTMTTAVATINAAVNCRTSRVIYFITCKKPRCRQQYAGKTVLEFRNRMYQHRVSVTGTDGKTGPNLEKAVGAHFNGPGHKVSDMSVTILEKVWNKDPMFLTVREEFWIKKMTTKHNIITFHQRQKFPSRARVKLGRLGELLKVTPPTL